MNYLKNNLIVFAVAFVIALGGCSINGTPDGYDSLVNRVFIIKKKLLSLAASDENYKIDPVRQQISEISEQLSKTKDLKTAQILTDKLEKVVNQSCLSSLKLRLRYGRRCCADTASSWN